MDEDEIITNPFEDDEDELEEDSIIYRTYGMDIKNKRIVGKVDGLEAVMQSIFKTLMTRRFAYLIYDDQYGFDGYNKIGNSALTQSYLETDMPSMIEDAFLNEDAILSIDDIYFQMSGTDGVQISLTVSTIFGDADFEGVITDG